MPPKFFYFDLGNVVLHFDRQRQCRQMGAAAGAPADRVHEVVFDSGLHWDYEAGKITSREFYDRFCRALGCRPDYQALLVAASDIFTLNPTIPAVIAQLEDAGHRLGMLSNTCEAHWNFISRGLYGILPRAFDVLVLSFEVGAIKPDEKIFRAAIERAGCRPEEIFYTDDTEGHVAAARALGVDAVQYRSTPQIVGELIARGVRFNY